MKFIRIFLLALIIMGVGLLATQNSWLPGLVNFIIGKENEPLAIPPTSVSTQSPLKISKEISSSPDPNLSSTSKIEDYAAVVTCEDRNPSSVYIFKDGSVAQIIEVHAADSGVSKCPPVEVQDINFDGYLDFMLLTNTGSGGGSYTYWLYSTSTKQFYCPNQYNDCHLMNPRFDPVSRTVVSSSPMGVGTIDTNIYGIADGKLILIKHERINY